MTSKTFAVRVKSSGKALLTSRTVLMRLVKVPLPVAVASCDRVSSICGACEVCVSGIVEPPCNTPSDVASVVVSAMCTSDRGADWRSIAVVVVGSATSESMFTSATTNPWSSVVSLASRPTGTPSATTCAPSGRLRTLANWMCT